jgi:hypothetical protein
MGTAGLPSSAGAAGAGAGAGVARAGAGVGVGLGVGVGAGAVAGAGAVGVGVGVDAGGVLAVMRSATGGLRAFLRVFVAAVEVEVVLAADEVEWLFLVCIFLCGWW